MSAENPTQKIILPLLELALLNPNANFFSNSFAFYINGSRSSIEELNSYVNRFWDPNRDYFAELRCS